MPEPRLSSEVLVKALLRKTEIEGGFSTVIRRGDHIAGALIIICLEKGKNPRLLEQMPNLDGGRSWQKIWDQDTDNKEQYTEYLSRRIRYDPDLWLIELDIPNAERLIAEMTANS